MVEDEEAKRFDLLGLRLELGILRQEDTFPAFCDQMKGVAGALAEMNGIPMVAARMDLSLDWSCHLFPMPHSKMWQ